MADQLKFTNAEVAKAFKSEWPDTEIHVALRDTDGSFKGHWKGMLSNITVDAATCLAAEMPTMMQAIEASAPKAKTSPTTSATP